MLRTVLLVLAFFSFPFNWCFAQAIRVITTKDGLPQSVVSGLQQDRNDFVWVATRNGLARYDGTKFKVFQHDIYNPATIASNLIISTAFDEKNTLWIEHESGEIDELNTNTEVIKHYPAAQYLKNKGLRFVRRGWLVDAKKQLWAVQRNGGLVCATTNGQVNLYSLANKGLPSDTIHAMTLDKQQNLWVLTQYGLSKFNAHARRFENYKCSLTPDFNNYFESEKEIIDLHQRSNGDLMWGDCRCLYFFSNTKHSFKTIPMPKANVHGVRWMRSGNDGKEYFENGGEIFEYTDKFGIKPLFKAGSGVQFDACSFMVDRSGLLWVGTNTAGIQQISLNTPRFTSYNYKLSFHHDVLEQLLAINADATFNWATADGPKAASSYHFRSVYDSHHNLWMALNNKVGFYNSKAKQVTQMPVVPINKVFKDGGIGIQGITITADGRPMVITYNGQILEWDNQKQKWITFINEKFISNKLSETVIPRDILNDGERLWITTDGDGLLVIDIKSKSLKQLKYKSVKGSLPTDKLLGILPDPKQKDILWIGGYEGLIYFNKKTLTCEVFSLKQGLPDNTIYSLQADKGGYLWLSTNKGLCRFNTQNKHVRIFQTTHGLPGDEFNRFHHLSLPDGRLAFGGPDGWTAFDPVNIRNDNFKPRVALTGLEINNTYTDRISSNNTFTSMHDVQELKLPHDQNTLTFHFAGLQFNQPNDLHYRFRMVGYDDDWIEADNLQSASYTKIPPGTYLFKVNASNTSGQWSNYIRYVRVTINSPWWLSWPAYILYGLILACLIWLYTRYRINKEIINRELELKQNESKQLREVDELKTRLFANITHEFRTPLTLILGPAQQLKREPHITGEHTLLAETIERNARHMLELINQLMDMARLEAKALTPREDIGSPAVAINAIVSAFGQEVNAKKITLSFEDSTNGSNYVFASDLLGHIIFNLLGNAVKYTAENGEIKIILIAVDEGIQLIVKDTGLGIPARDLPHVFKRFYQVGSSTAYKKSEPRPAGTGIGLSLVKEIVELQGGNIDVKSVYADEGAVSGTEFTVFLPYQKPDIQTAAVQEGVEHNATLVVNETSSVTTSAVILLVEDNPDLALFIINSLRNHYHVEHAWNGLEASNMALELMPDLVLSDVLMPVMDGLALCKILKEDLRTSHIPVLLLTARSGSENKIEGLEIGADDYLTKPFEVAELLLRIQNIFKRQQSFKDFIKRELSLPAKKESTPQVNVVNDEFIKSLYSFIDNNLDDAGFGVDQLLTLTNMSRTSLHRKVKAIAGMSTTELIRNYRLKCASVLLQQGHSSSDAAYHCGFSSAAYFSKCFRDVYGLTPGEFVKQSLTPN
ncbi:hybrid sensor histidine kinase/response regulator transcription factor [uncultured Mucilaginibacter sp.]|uniref:hybrid sensor histidine kinase/response regulator transcription factor n=1 Tax=uncultured Mucilaginibacter sp. TaxID=797541 RepID=UPI0025D82012|nr:hybrid sensor histidine kinase/response regulator transcription factor [uncultured Mucilaginibacter sp.]